MNTQKVVELERLEALIASWVGMKRMVRVPLQNTVHLAFYGELKMELDLDSEPMFYVIRQELPSPILVFYIKDVMFISAPDSENPQIWLKSKVDIPSSVE